MKTLKKIASMALILPMIYLSTACNHEQKQDSHQAHDRMLRQYPIISVEVPSGRDGTLDNYLREENVADRVSYNGISNILRKCNREDYSGFHSGVEQGWVNFREGKKVNVPDYNYDGKAMGVKGEPTNLILEIYKSGPSIAKTVPKEKLEEMVK